MNKKQTMTIVAAAIASVLVLCGVVYLLFEPPVNVTVVHELDHLPDADVWYLVSQNASIAQIESAIKQSGKGVDDFNQLGATLLGGAAAKGRMDLAKWLLEEGADPNGGHVSLVPLTVPIHRNDLPMVELLLEFGADPDFDLGGGDTPRSLARLMKSDARIIRALDDAGD